MPFGRFTNNGDFSEGDQVHEPSPKLSLAGGYSYNHKAQRASGQRGSFLFEARDLELLFIDAVFKYNGWAVYSEYMNRHTSNPITLSANPEDKPVYVYTGYGFLTQASYYFKNKIELGVRYSFVNPTSAISSLETRTDEYVFGVTKYLYKHRVKLQSNLIYQQKEIFSPLSGTKDRWIFHFQVELGI